MDLALGAMEVHSLKLDWHSSFLLSLLVLVIFGSLR